MPDLTTTYQWHCASAESWLMPVKGSRGDDYTILWNKVSHRNQENVQYDYSCDCKAYEFGNGKHCKHIKAAIASGKHCNWMQFTDGGEVVEKNGEHSCPECGENVHSMGWGI
jgi:hypothetical protein